MSEKLDGILRCIKGQVEMREQNANTQFSDCQMLCVISHIVNNLYDSALTVEGINTRILGDRRHYDKDD